MVSSLVEASDIIWEVISEARDVSLLLIEPHLLYFAIFHSPFMKKSELPKSMFSIISSDCILVIGLIIVELAKE